MRKPKPYKHISRNYEHNENHFRFRRTSSVAGWEAREPAPFRFSFMRWLIGALLDLAMGFAS